MNKALLMVAVAGVMGGVTAGALAQPAPSPPTPPAQAQPGGPPPPAQGMGPQARGPMMPPGDGMPGHRGWRHGAPSRAAAFHIERGDITIGVRCAESETMRACVDAAISLMEKANTLTTP